jgi:hypothetical protein
LAFAFPQFWYAIVNLASGQVLNYQLLPILQTTYDDYILTFFNISITSLPPFGFGFLEKDLSEEILETVDR